MKKSFSRIVLFSVVLCCVLYAAEYAIDSYYLKKANSKFTRFFAHKIDADIMIFGSSVAYHQLDPAMVSDSTGLQTYNMAWDAFFFVQYKALVHEFVSYSKRCKYVIFSCDFDNLGRNKLITRPDLFLALLHNDHVYEALHDIEPEKMWRARYVPGYKLTLLNTSFYRSIIFPPKTPAVDNGYSAVTTDDWEVVSDTLHPFHARFNEEVYASLKSTIDELTAKGIKVIIVMPPVYKEGYDRILNAEAIRERYAALVRKDVYFIDRTQDTLLSGSRSNFVNYSHLNRRGAEIYSRTLAGQIREIVEE
ncbi:hypothetical protein GCM10023093_23770 [Nemorincola caseinilytica]|uniref:SGNH/GDSL hydrolase family protein n=1 Tax=Nemorincola caseinilytica TaxID=2054315 RepID=A0ABP8NL28_9BACT